MNVEPLRSDLKKFLEKHNLTKKFDKQIKIFASNPRRPSLHTEILEPRELRLYSFRIDRKYRAIFIFTKLGDVEIVDINLHYR